MDSDRLKTIEEIFHTALETPPSGRAALLDAQCGDDDELRKEIESLLSFESAEEHFLDSAPGALAAEVLASQRTPKDLIGNNILHYKITRLLGIGGMGEVYLAEDTRLGRKVALKFLPEAFSDDLGRMDRFVREARSASGLNHPNIITIHEIGESNGKRFIATEYIDGRTLTELISSRELSTEAVLDIAIQLASALEEAHSAGIVHRDIKPDNIMVRPNGLVKVLDFGVAKLMEGPEISTRRSSYEPQAAGMTQAGLVIGTADYMSPEQARGGAIDSRSDIFSFGAVFYEMLCGRKAFSGENAAETVDAILHRDPVPLSDRVPKLPAPITAIVRRCLARSADDRYQRISDVLQELRSAKRAIDREDTDPARHTANMPAAKTLEGLPAFGKSRARRLPTLALGSLLAVLLSVGGFIGYSYFSKTEQIASIAVMPIENLSGDVEYEYLADGMTENLIRSLSTIPDLSIKARSSVFSFKGKDVSPKTIGSELNVDAVLLGRLAQAGDDLKITLEMVDSSSQDLLWSAEYSRKIGDLILLQRDIARDVSERLRPALSTEDRSRVAQNYSTNSEAEQLYLKGRFHWNKRTVRDFEKALRYFSRAVEKDPSYALAYTGTADTYALMPLYGDYRPTEYIPKAKQAALKALELDGELAEAHASLGYITTTYDYDWDRAEEHYRAALSSRPNYATAHQWYAEHLAFRGRTEEAVAAISAAAELDPFSLVINRMKGNILGFAGRHDEAIDQLNRTVELHPESPVVRFNLGEAYAAKGMYPEAIEQYLTGLRLDGRKNYEIRRYENAYKLKGWQGFWMEYLATLLTLQKAVTEADEPLYFDNESLAYAYAATKNKEKAIEYLYKAYESRDPHLVTIKTSGFYDVIRDDPRYKELLAKIGLPQ
ncbi:MAG: protein kinase [Acidobacteriota bacterium]|nr:MAG: protein kinase [Acidobacteriota bacterium]